MRISTSMIYDKGVNSLQQQWGDLLKTQQQLSTGRRVLTPAEDPIAAARALEVGQSKGVNSQFMTNIGYADDAMKMFESTLTSVGDILHYTRESAVRAGNGIMTQTDLDYIASDMKSQFEALVALANTKDGMGDYLFAGYRAQTQPYTGNLAGISYEGDQGERTIQVSASRYMPVSLPGSEVFDRTLAIDEKSVLLYGNADNGGSETLAVSAVDPLAARQATRYQISYSQPDPAVPGTYSIERLGQDSKDVPWTDAELEQMWPATPPATGFAVPDGYTLSADRKTITYTPDPTAAPPLPYQISVDGLTIALPSDPEPVPLDAPQEARTVKDEVADGDRFEIFVPSTNLLNNVAMFAGALERPGASGVNGVVAFALQTMDAGQENILKVRAQIGSQMTETQNLANLGSDLNLQYAEVISGLMDVDYVEAISRLTQQQTYLQAAQQSFMKVSNMSLFNYI